MKWIKLIVEFLLRALRIRSEQRDKEQLESQKKRQEAINDAQQAGDKIAAEANKPRPSLDSGEDPFSAYNRSRCSD